MPVNQASGARMLFTVSDFLGMRYLEQLQDHQLPELKQMVLLTGEADGALAWSDFLATGGSIAPGLVEQRAAEPLPRQFDFLGQENLPTAR